MQWTVYLVSAAHQRVRERFQQLLKDAGLTPPLYGTLRTLEASGPTSQQAIADQLGLSATAIQQTVDRLEAGDLVKRRRHPADRRFYALELTTRGRASLASARAAQNRLGAEIDDFVGGPRQQRDLRRLLLKLLDAPVATAHRSGGPHV